MSLNSGVTDVLDPYTPDDLPFAALRVPCASRPERRSGTRSLRSLRHPSLASAQPCDARLRRRGIGAIPNKGGLSTGFDPAGWRNRVLLGSGERSVCLSSGYRPAGYLWA